MESAGGEDLTGDDSILGTPAFLAPEQIHGEAVTSRTDLYSTGVMLYSALSGRLPHEASSIQALLRARLTARPRPLRELAPGVPPEVGRAVDQMLELDPEDRPRSASEVLKLLRGERLSSGASLPLLGGGAAVRELLAAARAGKPWDVLGPRGSGKTRCLEDAAAALGAEGRRVLFTTAGVRPFSSVAALAFPEGEPTGLSLAQMKDRVAEALGAALAGGAVIFVDDAGKVDSRSAESLARLDGAVVRAFAAEGAGHAGGGQSGAGEGGSPREGVTGRGAVAVRRPPGVGRGESQLLALREGELAGLFVGMDRLLHLREDAARALFKRTGGSPARVVREVSAWVRAGFARWDGERLAVDREKLDALEYGAIPGDLEPSQGLPAHADELLAWLVLLRCPADTALLAAVTGEADWHVEATLDELVSRDAARPAGEGQFEPTMAPRALEMWPGERRREAHRAIAAALPAGHPVRLWHLLAGVEDDTSGGDELAEEAVVLASALAKDGHLRRALAALGEALRVVRASGGLSDAARDRLFALWVEIALVDGTPRPLDRVLYELCRVEPMTPGLAHLEELSRAALSVDAYTDRALETLGELDPFEDPALRRRAWHVRVLAARRGSVEVEERVVEGIAAWAEASGDPADRASVAAFRGRLRYRQGLFAEAARLQREAAAGEEWVSLRVNAILNGASALLEACQFDEALAWAEEARALAEPRRHAFHEARATWIARSAAYRRGDALPVDAAFAEAIVVVQARELLSVVHLTEAAIAFRAGQSSEAVRLAGVAHATWVSLGQVWGAALARSLQIACGSDAEPAERDALLVKAHECPIPGIGAQVVGLLCLPRVGHAAPLLPVEPAFIEAITRGVPRETWHVRMEVLSMAEAESAWQGRATA
ncbi:MAG: hypothetical protein R3F14_26340, partial [Polyangiaceae bacterium]